MSDILQILVTNFGGLCRELANYVCREMNQKKKKKKDIEPSKTPGELPFSNRLVERNNKDLY